MKLSEFFYGLVLVSLIFVVGLVGGCEMGNFSLFGLVKWSLLTIIFSSINLFLARMFEINGK